jgi:hypothetical protein
MEQEAKPMKSLSTNARTVYIREYRKKRYAEDSTPIKDMNKAYYYKRTYGCSKEEWETYKKYTPQVCLIKKNLDILLANNIPKEVIHKLLESYLRPESVDTTSIELP